MYIKHFVLAFCCLALPVCRAESQPSRISVVADGRQDATEAIGAALAKAGENGGGEVYLPAGRYRVNGSLQIPSGVTLRGETKTSTKLVAPQGVDFNLLSMDGASDVIVRDLSLIEEGEAGKTSKGAALAINNGSRFVLVENVNLEGFVAGFSIGRAEKEESGNIVFRGCRAEKTRSFGFDLNNCREVLLESCYAYRNWLDGIKLRKMTRDVTIRGGESSYNGTSREQKSASNGNGVDAFAGGQAFLIDGLVTEYNQGSGIYMKTGKFHERGFGFVGNAMITNVRCRYNIGSGLDINRSGGDLTDAPLLANVTVVGGLYEGNSSSGIYVRGRNIAIIAPIVSTNGASGIFMNSAWDVQIDSPIIIANSRKSPGSNPGITLGAVHRVNIRGGVINGIEGEEQSPPSNEIYHSRAILITNRATDVEIAGTVFKHWFRDGDAVERQPQKPL